jgi:phosphoribosylglycinamide formyltransferase 1
VTGTRLAILISGRGSNMEALLQAAEGAESSLLPVLVVSNRPDAAGLETARNHGVPAIAIGHNGYGKDREAFERAMDAALRKEGVELVALAGFMRVLTPWFVGQWKDRLVNIHPSLLPKYPGVNTHERCLEAGDTLHGCTVHYVTSGVDDGPIIGQGTVRVIPGDTPDTLALRVLRVEHVLYALCLEAIANKIPTLPPIRRMRMKFDETMGLVDLWVPAMPEPGDAA